MKHPESYLLEKIVGYKENGLESLGHLNAKHVSDISKVMRDFALETLEEFIQRVNKGEAVDLGNGRTWAFKAAKKKKSSAK